ncbi:MAG: LysR family transcriptional regulator [Rhodocyclaceae bacterium]|nr:LysR family transcriptional regulator [Rhodocyclaceae bacterium]
MELYHLKTLVAVAEAGHLTRAAERLHLSQPTVSAHIRALEELLAITLFERTPKGMSLTPAGAELLPSARAALAAVERVRLHAGQLRGELRGVFRLGTNTDAGFLRLPALQRLMAERHPHLGLELLAGSSGANLARLAAGELDASFVSGAFDTETFDHVFVRDEEFAIAAPLPWRDALQHAGVEALASQPWIHNAPDHIQTRVLEAVFAPIGKTPMRAAVVNRKDSILAMVAAEVGLAISRREDIERAAATQPVCALPLRLPPQAIHLVWLPTRGADALLQAVVTGVGSVWDANAAA